MKKERKAENFIPKPNYPGGPRKMSAFIYKNLKYPEDAAKDQISGTVRIRIDIDYKGNVIGSQILSGLTPSCNEEAKRVVKLLKFEIPHQIRKGKIRYGKTLNIKFKPPQPKKEPEITQTKISYQITPSKPKKEATKEPPKSKTYSYTLTIK